MFHPQVAILFTLSISLCQGRWRWKRGEPKPGKEPYEWTMYHDLPNERLEMEHKLKVILKTFTEIKDVYGEMVPACPEDRASLDRWYKSNWNEHNYIFIYLCQRAAGRCSEEQMQKKRFFGRFGPFGAKDDWSDCAVMQVMGVEMYSADDKAAGAHSTADGFTTTADGLYQLKVSKFHSADSSSSADADPDLVYKPQVILDPHIYPGYFEKDPWSTVPAERFGQWNLFEMSDELLKRVKDQIAQQIDPHTNEVLCRQPGIYVNWTITDVMMNGSPRKVEYRLEHKLENKLHYYRMPISCNDRPYQGISFPLFQTMIEVVVKEDFVEWNGKLKDFFAERGDVTLVVLKTPLTYNKYFEGKSKHVGWDWAKYKTDKLVCKQNPNSPRCYPDSCSI